MRRLAFASAVVGVVIGMMPPASAAWTASASGNAVARATTVNAGQAPSLTASGDTVTLAWSASTLASAHPVTGYLIRRYDATGATAQIVASGSCASIVSSTTCSETAVPNGTWTYSVTPVLHNWRGAESPKSTVQVSVTASAPGAPTINSAPADLSNSASATFTFSHTGAGVGFECRLDGASWSSCTSPHSYSRLSNGSHTFEVRSVDAVGNRSAAASRTWVVDTIAPTAAITFPADNTTYNADAFTAGCGTAATGDLCGTSSDNAGGTGVSRVQVSLQQAQANYWNGTGFSSSTEVFFDASGTTSWSRAFNAAGFPADGRYTLRTRVTDAAGNVTTATSAFIMDITPPKPDTVQAVNGNGKKAGQIDVGGGDSILFEFNEFIMASSVMTPWDVGATQPNVTVRLNEGTGAGGDSLTVWNGDNTVQLPLGVVNLGGDYTTGNFTYPGTMTMTGKRITIVLGQRHGTSTTPNPVVTAPGTMTWTPGSGYKDQAGNLGTTDPVTELGTTDVEF